MNKRAKQRLIGVTLVIFVIIGGLVLGTNTAGTSATRTSVADVLADDAIIGRQVEVSGPVVAGSWAPGAKPLTFEIEDIDDSDKTIRILWAGVVPSAFGDGTTAIVTGIVGPDRTVEAKTLITQCPSKYESAKDALLVTDVLSKPEQLVGKTVKVTGFVAAGTIQPAGGPERFAIAPDKRGIDALSIHYDGALPDGMKDGSKVVITGSLEDGGSFAAADVAIDADAK